MEKEKITQQRLKELLSYDPSTGIFTRLVCRYKSKIGTPMKGSNSHGWIYLLVDKKTYPAHHLAWLYCYGEFPSPMIDHIDGDSRNNRIANLRVATKCINMQNIRKPYAGEELPLGVTKKSKYKYRAQIRPENGKNVYIGSFNTPEEAHEAYLKAKRDLHRGCTI